MTGQVRESQKSGGINIITTTTSIDLLKPVSINLQKSVDQF